MKHPDSTFFLILMFSNAFMWFGMAVADMESGDSSIDSYFDAVSILLLMLMPGVFGFMAGYKWRE